MKEEIKNKQPKKRKTWLAVLIIVIVILVLLAAFYLVGYHVIKGLVTSFGETI